MIGSSFPTGIGVLVKTVNRTVPLRLTVLTNTPIPVGNELPIMSVGSVQCDGSYVDGSTQRMMFECPAQDLWLADGAQITVRSNARAIWNFGAFSRKMLK